jgi:FAD/FMN-containing dehydrogenase
MQNVSVEPHERAVHCEAGAVLERVQHAAAASGFVFPLDMGSKGSATVGGAAATNAGGIHVVRYGTFRSNILGLRAVLANGDIIDRRSHLRKDNTGLDLKQLFIGSEGVLGCITDITVALHPAPSSVLTISMRCATVKSIQEALGRLASACGPCLGAFEVMDREGLNQTGTPADAEYTVVSDVYGYGATSVDDLLKIVADSGVDAEVADSETKRRRLWATREELPVRLAKLGDIHKFDLSLDTTHFYDVVEVARRELERAGARDDVVVTGYGHFGDGNVHLNIVDKARRHKALITDRIATAVYDFTVGISGSISAEHGIGVEKKAVFHRSARSENLALMRAVKGVCDPLNLMNPGAML